MIKLRFGDSTIVKKTCSNEHVWTVVSSPASYQDFIGEEEKRLLAGYTSAEHYFCPNCGNSAIKNDEASPEDYIQDKTVQGTRYCTVRTIPSKVFTCSWDEDHAYKECLEFVKQRYDYKWQ